MSNNRRNFLKKTGLAGLTAATALPTMANASSEKVRNNFVQHTLYEVIRFYTSTFYTRLYSLKNKKDHL